MKRINITYWIVTALFAGFMIFSAIPDALLQPEAVEFLGHLGYPKYFMVFIGIAKILGSIAILIPGFPRIKEWAYAGLSFDLIGAVYSILSVEKFQPSMLFLVLPIVFCGWSYYLYHKRAAMLHKPHIGG